MMPAQKIRIAALIDLPRDGQAGGHVKGWERLTTAGSRLDLPFELTTFFSGVEQTERLSPQVRIRQLPPVFSTERLKFLPYLPSHTDLAGWHPRLARELDQFDLIHTTDGFFAFAQTAERMSARHKIPLTTAFHTDTPGYARIFTQQTIKKIVGENWFSRFLNETLDIPGMQQRAKLVRLREHLRHCRAALVAREEDRRFALSVLPEQMVWRFHSGYDPEIFNPQRRDRAGVLRDYNVPDDRLVLLFVGRVDIGKNIYTLVSALENLLAEGLPLHLITAGVGPAEHHVRQRLGTHATVAGYVAPLELARLYASVDGLALVSEVETRSMACGEALASGCPVLNASANGIADHYGHTVAMMNVTGGVAAWSEAIREFAAHPAKRAAMRASALEDHGKYLRSWGDILLQDLWPFWQMALQGN